jgi:hypothetical protein
MSISAIISLALFALIGWNALVEAVREVLVARARAACPCRDLHSLKVTAPDFRTRFSADGSKAAQPGFEAARWKGH